MKYFDTHMHLDDEKFDIDREDVIKKMQVAGVKACINMGCNIESSKKAIELANEHSFIYAACGIHPEDLPENITDLEKNPQIEQNVWKTLKEIENLAKENKKVVAIGEIGLDYYWRQNNKEFQKEVFIKQIEIANRLSLPISIHTREAIDDTIQILRRYKINKHGVLHCCPFNPELVRQGLQAGLYIAFGGTSTFKSSKNAQKIVEMVPLDKILVETDSPYLAPEPVRGTRNDSSNLKYIVKRLAEFRGMSEEEMGDITYKNAEKLFIENKEK